MQPSSGVSFGITVSRIKEERNLLKWPPQLRIVQVKICISVFEHISEDVLSFSFPFRPELNRSVALISASSVNERGHSVKAP